MTTTTPRAAGPEIGARLRRAWIDGTLLGEAGPGGVVRPEVAGAVRAADGTAVAAEFGAAVEAGDEAEDGAAVEAEVAGIGESYVAWRVAPRGRPALTVRIPWRDVADLAQPLGPELAALRLVPPGLGPLPLALWADVASSPIGLPCLVTGYLPGRTLPPSAWTPAHLRAHARCLARLHRDALPGRGRILPGEHPTAGLVPGPLSMVAEVDGAFDWWREHHPEVCAAPEVAALMESARAHCALAEDTVARTATFVLAHGDLCATNIVWDVDARNDGGDGVGEGGDGVGDGDGDGDGDGRSIPRPRYIDFEWAQADDRARDVAIIGGPVHGGPWYVPMDAPAMEDFLAAYVEAARELDPAAIPDVDALRVRRDAWIAYERTAMLLHVTRRAAEGDPVHVEALPVLRSTLAAWLAGTGTDAGSGAGTGTGTSTGTGTGTST